MQTYPCQWLAAPLLLLSLPACGSSSVSPSADPGSASCPDKPTTGTLPADVATVLADKCQACHANPPTNGAPFPLVTYADTLGAEPLAPYAGQPIWQVMEVVIQPGADPQMPLAGSPPLTSQELQTLNAWLSTCALRAAEESDGGSVDGAPTLPHE